MESGEITSPLVGRHNVQNSLAAAGAAVALGVPLEAVVEEDSPLAGAVPGRLQRVMAPEGAIAGLRCFGGLCPHGRCAGQCVVGAAAVNARAADRAVWVRRGSR